MLLATASKKAKNNLTSSQRNKTMMQSYAMNSLMGGSINPMAAFLSTKQAVDSKIAEERAKAVALAVPDFDAAVADIEQSNIANDRKEEIVKSLKDVKANINLRLHGSLKFAKVK